MATNYVAAVDGVLLRVGDRIVSLYRDGAVPQGADADHVKVLADRGLLVKADKDADDAVAEADVKARDGAAEDSDVQPAKAAPRSARSQ